MRRAHQFNIEQLRKDVVAGVRPLRVTSHAQTEAFKDGLTLVDLRYVFNVGEVIELYPDENRGLLYAKVDDIEMPVHIVIEDTSTEGIIITAYIPDRRLWISNRIRRSRRP
ncbi:MAG: DUF4258 domain-containing protein [Caldilineaceae bacterium]